MTDLVFRQLPVQGTITGRYLQTEGYDSPHMGVDIAAPVGTPIYAPAGGTLTLHPVGADGKPTDGWGDGSFGNCMVIDHPGTPYYSLYAHMRDFNAALANGAVVGVGQLLGFVGLTGKTTGSHVHWQVSKSSGFPKDANFSADPLSFLNSGPAPLSLEDRVMLIQQVLCNTVLNPDSGARLSGDEALRFAAARGYSTLLSAQENNLDLQELANHVADLADGAWDDPHLRDDLITTFRDFADSLEAKK